MYVRHENHQSRHKDRRRRSVCDGTANRHGDVLRFVGGLGYTDYGKWEQGFIAEINGEEKFVGRAQAWHIAGDAGQLKDVNRKESALLFSEDLW